MTWRLPKGLASLLLGLSAMLTLSTSLAYAGPLFDDVCNGNGGATVCQEQNKTQTKADNSIYGRNGVIIKAVNIMAIVVGVAAVMGIAISGVRFTVSQGDSNSISTARKTIIYSVVGLVIMIASRSIIVFVLNRL